eukprot:2010078-Pyramimonas_sp.AAC.1
MLSGADLSAWISVKQICDAPQRGCVECGLRAAGRGQCPLGRYVYHFEVRDGDGNVADATLEVRIFEPIRMDFDANVQVRPAPIGSTKVLSAP